MEKQMISVVRNFLASKAESCVHEPEGMLKYRFVTPSYAVKAGADDKSNLPERSRTGHYLQMYDWDSCFFSQAAASVGIEGLQKDVVANFLSLKSADGHLPRTISPQRIWDAGDCCKPFLCQTLLSQIRSEEKPGKSSTTSSPATKQADAAKNGYSSFIDDLDCYLEYYLRNRKSEHGLFRWRNVLESGVDDNLALLSPREAAKDEDDSIGSFPDGKLIAVDLSSYLCAEFSAFAEICRMQSRADLASKYEKLARDTARAIDDQLWNKKLSMYCNLNPKDGTHVELRAWTGLAPAMLGIAKHEYTQEAIERNLIEPKHFFRPAAMSSVAASELLYNNAVRGLYGRAIVSNWQGPVWVLSNALALRCLLREGYKKEAQELSLRLIQTLYKDIKNNNTLHENYHAETGEALWAPQFMSWNILALEHIEVLS